MLLLSLPLLLPFYLWEYSQRGGFALNAATISALAYYGTIPSIVAYLFWNRGVAQVGASRAGLFVHLMPVFGALLSMMFLGERLHAYHFAGAVLIFGVFTAFQDLIDSPMEWTEEEGRRQDSLPTESAGLGRSAYELLRASIRGRYFEDVGPSPISRSRKRATSR
jgi:hypothetical protein